MAQKAIGINLPAGADPNISADDHAALFHAIVGADGNMTGITCTRIDNNTVRLSAGEVMVQGHQLRILGGTTQDLTVTSGTGGQNRIDLVVGQYERRASDEDADVLEFAVVQGTPTAGTPSDPSLTTQDINVSTNTTRQIALFRLFITGTTLATPRRIRTPVGTLADVARLNLLINGGFDVWQWGTSQTSNGYGSDDRWNNAHSGSTKTHTRQAFTAGQTSVPGNPRFYSRTVVTSSAGAGNLVQKYQRVEDVYTASGQSVALSFWAKADAAKNIAVEFLQNFGSGGDASVTGIGSQLVALTTTWQRYEITVAIPSVAGKTIGAGSSLTAIFWLDAGSNYNARAASLGQQSGTFEFARVKLEIGSIATAFVPRTFAEEIALCKPYYCKSYDYGTAPETSTTVGCLQESVTRNNATSTIGARYGHTMRAVPTIKIYSTGGAIDKILNNGDKDAVAEGICTEGFRSVTITTGETGASSFYHYTADAEL